ncbi:MAG: hypothetical protein CVV64_04315 [Candidatus Wallbacteria bacterium HGW-Wallbacteria-1]|jgi:glutamate dehydrogenase (NAD(P)+)|uniref:Glutamate/phenylalanine/leucine/valine/L-tryptophan dehydrogenase C-terminal domain-containing protein n=1 Tax=Candidatus Wallbacteria bacterium HGW-Wallbacteria-1 TaxID=2013854 RepID=A0A2N1PRV8_9BACT|nr:MAG: hypothetical protein CVV64_04315 [Candidatus Wallbacteria bacterium HGW-Wallbacteria-1]
MDLTYDPRDPFFSAAMAKFEKASSVMGLSRRVKQELCHPQYEHISYVVVPLHDRFEPVNGALEASGSEQATGDLDLLSEMPCSRIDIDMVDTDSRNSIVINQRLLENSVLNIRNGSICLPGKRLYRLRKDITHTLKCYRVQYNDVRGAYMGGLGFAPSVNLDYCKAMGAEMTWRTAALNIPFGGAYGGVKMDRSLYAGEELTRIQQAYMRAMKPVMGPERDIPGRGQGVTAADMTRMMEAYLGGDPQRHMLRGSCTGKDIRAGGCQAAEIAGGMALFYCIEEWFKTREETKRGIRLALHELDFSRLTFIVRGFDETASACARHLVSRGARCLAIADSRGAVIADSGLDVEELYSYVHENPFNSEKSVLGYPNAEFVGPDDFWSVQADVLVVTSSPWTLNGKRAGEVKVDLVAEGECNCISSEGDDILNQRGISTIPAVIGSSGSVIASYYEWLQNHSLHGWNEEEVLRKLAFSIKTNYAILNDISKNTPRKTEYYDSRPFCVGREVDPSTAGMILCLRRIEQQYLLRGLTLSR